MGTRKIPNGTPNLPNGTLICQKGPVFPRWDPIWLRGHMFTGRVFRHLPLYYPSRVDCICLQQLLFAGHALSAF